MNNSNHHTLPPDLDERLADETQAEQEDLAAVWRQLGNVDVSPAEAPDSEVIWTALQTYLNGLEIEPPSTYRPRSGALRSRTFARHARPAARNHSRRRIARWVAAPVLVIVAALAGFLWWQQPVSVSAPFGEMRLVTLPDGSAAHLNSGATLSWQRGFQSLPFISSRNRVVHLQGEAFFDVRHREGAQPFAAETFNARVVVPGTEFNVRADRSALETRVTLVSGRVRMEGYTPDENEIILNQSGQTSLVAGLQGSPNEPHAVNLERVLVWRREGFAVQDEPLPAIFARLERRYDVRLTLYARDSSGEPMTLYYPTKTDLKTILHDICVARDLNYRMTSRGYEVFRAP